MVAGFKVIFVNLLSILFISCTDDTVDGLHYKSMNVLLNVIFQRKLCRPVNGTISSYVTRSTDSSGPKKSYFYSFQGPKECLLPVHVAHV